MGFCDRKFWLYDSKKREVFAVIVVHARWLSNITGLVGFACAVGVLQINETVQTTAAL